ncbi:MAG: ACP phosphodiesterase [Cytophagales bacterium]|nr:ACP phosphodiesterase [Cytophagales bacterium]
MNFIAHLLLSGTHHEVILGNFIGDGVKGDQYKQYPPNVQKGIALHRLIDDFTDTHTIVKHSKSLLQPYYNHYSGILVDIFYDYFLTNHWDKYSAVPIQDFSHTMIQILLKFKPLMPQMPMFFLDYIVKNNRIMDYNKIETIEAVLQGMARRTKYTSGMEQATTHLKIYHQELEADFLTFFPQLRQYTTDYLAVFENA